MKDNQNVASATEVNYVKYKDNKKSSRANAVLRGKSGPLCPGSVLRGAPSRTSWHQDEIRNCQYCGTNHKRRQCPAFGKACKTCGKIHHFAKVCRHRSVDEVADTFWINTILQNNAID